MDSIFLNKNKNHNSWEPFINNKDIIKQLADIEHSINGQYTPEPGLALRFLNTDLIKTKIIILGQDPYPQPGAATGRAFEVNGLKSWTQGIRQSSLRNILRNIHASYNFCEPAPLNEIRDEILSGAFKIPPPDKIFGHWEEQGVLCLNTAFTCRAGSPGSHSISWKPFAERLIMYIAQENKHIIWFLWGKAAQEKEVLLNGAKTYKCNHPMLPGKGEGGFLNCGCFRETMDIVNWI